MGLTRDGYEPETLNDILTRIKTKLGALAPNIDFSPESPDGQLLHIFAAELATFSSELYEISTMYDPRIASGAALRNLTLITGVNHGDATRSYVSVKFDGMTGKIVPKDTIVTDATGKYQFKTVAPAVVSAFVNAVCTTTGPVEVPAGLVTKLASPVLGISGVSQPNAGVQGRASQTESQIRNFRQRTVMRNATSTAIGMRAALEATGVSQVVVEENDTGKPLPNGTPDGSIHVIIGATNGVTNEAIAKTIMNMKTPGVPLHGGTKVTIKDEQDHDVEIAFDISTSVSVAVEIEVKFLSKDVGGAQDAIKKDVAGYINSLKPGDDVVWSFIFQHITPHAQAQVNVLKVGKVGETLAAGNLVIAPDEYAVCDPANITVTEAGTP